MISIIIPTYNRIHWIKKCLYNLDSFLNDHNFEIIVVDDGSSDGTLNFLKDFTSRSRTPIRVLSQKRQGPAKARNVGVNEAKGQIVCFLDDDSIVQSTWATTLFESSTLLNGKFSAIKGNVRAYQNLPFPLFLEKHLHKSDNWVTNNIAYRKDIFNEIGGFDEEFTIASWEDVDLGLRMERSGYQRIYNPNMIVRHPHEENIENLKKKFMVNGYGFFQFCKKWIQIEPKIIVREWFNRFMVFLYLLPVMKKIDFVKYLKGLRLKYEIYALIRGILNRGKIKQIVKD
jgi:GT2 family glycosyltransferase